MSAPGPWEAFFAEHFPAYLLPQSLRRALPAEVAARFLERLCDEPRALFLLRASSLLAARAEDIRAFVLEELPLLALSLPPRAQSDARLVLGGVEGRLDVPATLKKQKLEGRPSHAVVRSVRLRFDRPETLLLKAVAARLLEVLSAVRGTGADFPGMRDCEEALAQMLATTALGEIAADEPITPFHEQAALEARSRGYALAASIYQGLREALDVADPETLAKLVAEGARIPIEPPARFELAALIRLIQALWSRVEAREPGRWSLRRTIILPERADVAELERDDGARVRLFYNQAVLSPGPLDRGVHHYLGQQGRLRPDITLVMRGTSGVSRAAVIEVKLSSEPGYLAQGYRQAFLYFHELAPALTAWPKAILVSSSPIPGSPRREDDVIAIDWDRWVPDGVLDSWLDSLSAAS